LSAKEGTRSLHVMRVKKLTSRAGWSDLWLNKIPRIS